MLKREDYINKVFNADVMEIIRQIPDESIDMVFVDPDYNVGIDYNGKKYKMSWEKYTEWYTAIAKECLRVLKKDGNLFLLNYPKQNAHLRAFYLDGAAKDVHEYVWLYNSNVGHTPRRFTTAHRTILHATKSKKNKFYKTQVAQPYKNPEDKRIRKRLSEGSNGRMPYDWFYFDMVKNVSREKTMHPCQVPSQLIRLLINASTKRDDDVFVLFGGSGGELLTCRNAGRNFVSCEANEDYYRLIQMRLGNMEPDGAVLMDYHTDSSKLPEKKKNDTQNQLTLKLK